MTVRLPKKKSHLPRRNRAQSFTEKNNFRGKGVRLRSPSYYQLPFAQILGLKQRVTKDLEAQPNLHPNIFKRRKSRASDKHISRFSQYWGYTVVLLFWWNKTMCPEPSSAKQDLQVRQRALRVWPVSKCSVFRISYPQPADETYRATIASAFLNPQYPKSSERLRVWVNFRWIWPQPRATPTQADPFAELER